MSSTGGTTGSTARFNWISFWIYTGLLTGALVSVSANIAYTFIPPPTAPPWWPTARPWDRAAYRPPFGDVAFAVFCPVAILIVTEVITRPRWRGGILSAVIRVASALMVGLPVAVVSYLHLYSLLSYYGSEVVIAFILPLPVDGMMLACTAALQLTGPEAVKKQVGKSDSTPLPDRAGVVPPPRAPVDDAVPAPLGEPLNAGAPPMQWPVIPTAAIARSVEAPPAGPASTSGGRPQGTMARPYPLADSYESPEGGGSVPVAPPVGLLGPPAGSVLLPLELLGRPPSPVGPSLRTPVGSVLAGGAESAVPEPTGGPTRAPDGGVPGRPVPFGRLGASDLTDVEIIELAVADNPHGKVTGTALRKDFGVGPGRAGRIRDAITRRRLTARLAIPFHEEIERRATKYPRASERSAAAGETSASPDSTGLRYEIKASAEDFPQGY